MTIEANKALVKEHFDYMARGEYLKAIEKFADDMLWWVIGTQPDGGAQTKADLTALYRDRLPGYLPNGIQVVLDRMIGEGDWVTVQGHGLGNISASGANYANHYCWLFEIRDGEVKEFREYLDTYHARQAFYGEDI
jgi:ketosteroid isomerase-like protein